MNRNSKKSKIVILSSSIFFVLIVIIVMVIEGLTQASGITKVIASNNVIEILISDATSATELSENTIEFELNEDNFIINKNSYFYFPFQFYEGSEITQLNKRIPKRILDDYSSAKELIKDFINEYFDNKYSEPILNELDKTNLVIGDFSTSGKLQSSSAVYENGRVYLNSLILKNLNYYPDELFLFTFTHELIHMAEHVTNPNGDYDSFRLKESFTDIIAKAIYDYSRPDGGYSESYAFAYELINRFGEKAIYSYFFGFSNLFDDFSKEKFDTYNFLVEASTTVVMSDGMSNLDAYSAMTGLTKDEIKELAFEILYSKD